jgi:hypothetical protein
MDDLQRVRRWTTVDVPPPDLGPEKRSQYWRQHLRTLNRPLVTTIIRRDQPHPCKESVWHGTNER